MDRTQTKDAVTESSLPPIIKNNGPKYLAIGLIVLGAVVAWWFSSRGCEPAPPEVSAPPPVQPAESPREQFAEELEIPDDVPDAGKRESTKTRQRAVAPTCKGTLDASAIRGVIDGQPRNQVRACYERRLKENNLLQGSMSVLVTIDKLGAVSDVRTTGSLKDKHVFSCVKNVARKWKFPPPEGGCVQTSIPFTLTPQR